MVAEKKKRRKKSRWAAYGPGPYGGYGFAAGYSGDGGIGEDQDLTELNVAATLKFIKDAHGDQLYGKLPYWTHPRAVALTGRKIFGSRFNSDAVKAAFLHDVVEDTETELSDLKALGFSDRVVEAVALLTKDKSLTYFQNIDRIIQSGNEIAQMVKYADNYENYTGDKSDWASDRASSSNQKYLKSLNRLGDHLGIKHHIDEASYEGNIGAMEVAKFFRQATDEEKNAFKELLNQKKLGLAWHLIQKVTGVKLKGQEFQEDRTADVVFDTGEKKKVRYHPTSRDIVDIIVNYYLKQGLKVIKVNDEEIEWDDSIKEGFQQRSINKLMALGMQGPYSKRDLVGINRAWSNTLKGIRSSQIMVQDADNPQHSAWIAPAGQGQWMVGAETGYTIKSGPEALKRLQFLLKPTNENFADGKKKGKSRPGRVKQAGASCKGSVTDLRAKARKYGGERGKMYHWCGNMKAGRNK